MTDQGPGIGLSTEVTMLRCPGCGQMLSVMHSSGRRQSVTLYRISCPRASCGLIQHVGLIGEYIGVESAQAAVLPVQSSSSNPIA